VAIKKESSDRKKGTFGAIRLPVSKQYVMPPTRRRMLLYGLIVAALLAAWFLLFGGVSKGRLSSAHASLEKDCAACHKSFRAVTSEKCSTCHEKVGDRQGTYSLASHAIYRSGDASRAHTRHEQLACFACHPEHGGRDAAITRVPDKICARCHGFKSFDTDHPQFAFAAKKIADDADIEFPHSRHVLEIMKKDRLADVEKACLRCHHPREDGSGFQPIAFDASCTSCHMGEGTRTAALPVRNPAQPQEPGVETLEMIRASGRPDSYWTSTASTADFRMRGDSIVKAPLRHKDPWIMDNLRRIRRALYPGEGVQELLDARGSVESEDREAFTRTLYAEALATLRKYRDGLAARSEPEIHQELSNINALLQSIEKRIDASQFVAPPPDDEFFRKPELNRNLSAVEIEQLRNFALDLTEPCRQCHVVTDAAIQRVQKDQRILHRAHFDHRAHILQRRCLDCHNRIRIEAPKGGAKVTIGDRSDVQNIPGIESCRECHNAKGTTHSCASCHYYHPDKTRRSSMLLYVDAARPNR
jgi:hypothetical protein